MEGWAKLMRMTDRRYRLLRSPLTVLGIPIVALFMAVGSNTEGGISVSPLQQEIQAKPGTTAEFTLTLTNVRRSPSASPERVRLEIVDFTVSLLGSISFGDKPAQNRSAVSWIELDGKDKDIVLEPEQVRLVKGKIYAPRGTDGDYWAALLVTPVEPVQENGVSVILRTASALFIRVQRRNHVERLSVNEVEAALPDFGPRAISAAAAGAGQTNAPDDDRSLKIQADVENTGPVSCTASGKAHLYLNGIRKVASIPLHARSRRILPGESRRFIGVLPAALPAGEYSLRVIFKSDTQDGQKGYREARFTVDDHTAQIWKEFYERGGAAKTRSGLAVNAAALTLNLQPGRFTMATIPISNGGGGTMQVTCRLNGEVIQNGWLSLDQAAFTLGPRMRRSVLCRIAVPENAPPGDYAGNVVFETEVASLADRPGPEASTLPVRIMVKK
jgi:hypothetical protein